MMLSFVCLSLFHGVATQVDGTGTAAEIADSSGCSIKDECVAGSTRNLVMIGSTGTMLSPSAAHLSVKGSPAKVVGVLARLSSPPDRVEAWRSHGAAILPTVAQTLNLAADALVICVGKNADDLPIVTEACSRWAGTGRAVLHLSTISPFFAEAAAEFCRSRGVRYGNFPLTGGPIGAREATMLILASGDEDLYQEYLPVFEAIGRPRYFGVDPGRAAEVKLQGQMMVFGGLLGISSATAVSFASSGESVAQSAEVADLIGFLNGGAGSTRQWEAAVARGVRDGDWQEGFQAEHAAIDALYAAGMALSFGVSRVTQNLLLTTAGSLAFLVERSAGGRVATQAIAQQLLVSDELDTFLEPLWRAIAEGAVPALHTAMDLLPEKSRTRVLLNVSKGSFEDFEAVHSLRA